jgi:hypothetical protein
LQYDLPVPQIMKKFDLFQGVTGFGWREMLFSVYKYVISFVNSVIVTNNNTTKQTDILVTIGDTAWNWVKTIDKTLRGVSWFAEEYWFSELNSYIGLQ